MDGLSGSALPLLVGWLVAGTLLLAILVAVDARRRGHPTVVWFLVALVLPLFGAVAYLLCRAPSARARPVTSTAAAPADDPITAPMMVPLHPAAREEAVAMPTAAPSAPEVEWRRGAGVLAEPPPPAVVPPPAAPVARRRGGLIWPVVAAIALLLVVGALAALTDGFGLAARGAALAGRANAPAATSVPTPAPTPPPSAVAPPPTAQPAVVAATEGPAPADGPLYYTVAEGDTLGEIAEQHGTTIDALLQANNLDDPDMVVVGQRLLVKP